MPSLSLISGRLQSLFEFCLVKSWTMEAPQFIKSQKGKQKLLLNGYSFTQERVTKASKIIWKCVEWTPPNKCLGRCHTLDGIVTLHNEKHNHAPDGVTNDVLVLKNRIRDAAGSSSATTAHIVAECLSTVPEHIVMQLSKINTLKRMVINHRPAEPESPSDLQSLTIKDEYALTAKGDKFLLYDSEDAGRILMFSTDANINILKECNHWYYDGTFKSAPRFFVQLFTIFGQMEDGTFIPLIYWLLPNKAAETYDSVFDKISELIGEGDPDTVMSDYESATLNVFKKYFPTTTQRGCHFHFQQCLWRKIQSESSILTKYKSDTYFSFHLKYLPALAFLPAEDVITAYEEIIKMPFFVENGTVLKPFVQYFQETWVGKKRRGRRTQPMFPVKLWNVREAVLEGIGKTNKTMEGFHRSLSSILNASYPSIWKLINALKSHRTFTEVIIKLFNIRLAA